MIGQLVTVIDELAAPLEPVSLGYYSRTVSSPRRCRLAVSPTRRLVSAEDDS
jgi:hypothetical protein